MASTKVPSINNLIAHSWDVFNGLYFINKKRGIVYFRNPTSALYWVAEEKMSSYS